jgi:hypothetical protein
MNPQRISPLDAAPVSRTTYAEASAQQGIGGMTTGVPEINNLDDSGLFSKPYANAQPELHQNMRGQDIRANTTTARSQGAVSAMRMQEKMNTEASDAQAQAQYDLNRKLASIMDANEMGASMLRLNNRLQENPDAFYRNIETGSMMSNQMTNS